MKGKWSVNSQMFQNNHCALIDRVKEILLKSTHDTEKITQIKMLMNIPNQEEPVIKIEEIEDDNLRDKHKLEIRSFGEKKIN